MIFLIEVLVMYSVTVALVVVALTAVVAYVHPAFLVKKIFSIENI